jgi:serine protease DegQ
VKATEGVIITGVLQDGPAAQAGMRPGDVIVKVVDKPVANVSELLSSVAALTPGTPAQFTVMRGNDRLQLKVTPGLRPKPRTVQR